MEHSDDWAVQLAHAAGEGAEVGDAFGVPVFDVSVERWVVTLQAARDSGLAFFDWLSAVDELDEGFSVVAHVADQSRHPVLHLLLRTRIPRDAPVLPSATAVYRGAAWHERETHEMFGISYTGHPDLRNMYLPTDFEGYPLRKDFPLLARMVKPWPGIVDVEPMPGEAADAEAEGEGDGTEGGDE
jgi:NADH-quinone oxidoreductase subunit C